MPWSSLMMKGKLISAQAQVLSDTLCLIYFLLSGYGYKYDIARCGMQQRALRGDEGLISKSFSF